MARPLRITYPGAYYHVTARGNEQKDVFRSKADREQFLIYLESAVSRYGAVIHAYCLMSNHYHLLLETPDGNLSEIMHHINGAYTTYFNIKRKRAGHLFQGRYKALLVEADAYLAQPSRYIHLNPVRAGIVARPEAYAWSSYRNYIGSAESPPWLKKSFILAGFSTEAESAGKRYRAFVEEQLGQEYENPLKDAFGASILGSPEFREKITERHLNTQQSARDVPALKRMVSRPSLESIVNAVTEELGDRPKVARQASLHLCHRYCGEKLQIIGTMFKVRESAVSEASRLFVLKLDDDRELAEKVARVKERLII